jgi:hypothetical protein
MKDKNKRFRVVGMPENIDIPDKDESEEDQDPRQSGFRIRMDKDNIMNFLESIKNDPAKAMIDEKEMNRLIKETNMSKEQIDRAIKEVGEFFQKNLSDDLVNDLKNMVENKGSNLTQQDADKVFDDIFKTLQEGGREINESLEDNEFDVEDNSSLGGEHCHDYNIILNPDSFGAVVSDIPEKIYDKFVSIHGKSNNYDIKIFSPNIIVVNGIDALKEVVSLDYLEHTDNYILFKTVMLDAKLEPFVVAIIQEDGEFDLVVPEYGNTYNYKTKQSINIENDKNFYFKSKDGKQSLMFPIDIDKIKTGLELVMFEKKTPVMSLVDFGRIIPTNYQQHESGRWVRIGKIQSNDLPATLMFKVDFDLKTEQKLFDFFVKLPKEYPARIINALAEYLSGIDFNENNRTVLSELKANSNKELYIDMDLGLFPDFILKWRDK